MNPEEVAKERTKLEVRTWVNRLLLAWSVSITTAFFAHVCR